MQKSARCLTTQENDVFSAQGIFRGTTYSESSVVLGSREILKYYSR